MGEQLVTRADGTRHPVVYHLVIQRTLFAADRRWTELDLYCRHSVLFFRLEITCKFPALCQSCLNSSYESDKAGIRQFPYNQRIPKQVYGHTFTAKERAALQDGKSVYIPNLKGAGGKKFARYIKPSSTGQLNYYMTDPDVKRDTSQRVAQKENARPQNINQKRGVAV